jgi:prepilin-type N-terminal cleavage/methylation domain-containing protein
MVEHACRPRTDPRRGARRSSIDRRAGFTIVEVIVAMVVLAVGVLGLAGTTAHIVRQVTLADIMTERAAALQTAVERVQATDWDAVDTGVDSVGIYGVEWSSTLVGAQLKEVTIITYGPGLETSADNPYPVLAQQVADTFAFRLVRP